MATSDMQRLPRYDRHRTYDWNYEHAPDPVEWDVTAVPGTWTYCGLPVSSPLGIAAGPLLNGRWCLYYASLGFDVLTYKTVRSRARECYPMPNLQPVACGDLVGGEPEVSAISEMKRSWAVSYGMPSKDPAIWRADVEATRGKLPPEKILAVSVVASVCEGETIDDLAADYARCARWALDSGADVVETNFSCPNVSTRDGQLFQQPSAARQVAETVRAAIGPAPYIVKIGHVATAEEAARLLEAVGPSVDAIAMTNSVATRVRQEQVWLFAGQPRGICGEAILAASIQQVRQFANLVENGASPVQLLGVGGISMAEHVQAYLTAGANACLLATSAMVDPLVGIKIRQTLAHGPSPS